MLDRSINKEFLMEHVAYKDTVRHANSPRCTVYEYPMKNSEMNIAVAEILQRYPDQGYVMNCECDEMGYILKGSGKLITETQITTLSVGDVVYIPHGEKYYFDGNLTIILPCAPAWYPQPHKTILSSTEPAGNVST